jgi:hypothetical protein
LESGATPIRFVISSRRMIYLQTILKREASGNVKYEHLFSSTPEQNEANVLFKRLFDARD